MLLYIIISCSSRARRIGKSCGDIQRIKNTQTSIKLQTNSRRLTLVILPQVYLWRRMSPLNVRSLPDSDFGSGPDSSCRKSAISAISKCSCCYYQTLLETSSSAIAERPRCRVGQLWPKVEDWDWETIFTDYIDLYSTTATYIWPAKQSKSAKNAK